MPQGEGHQYLLGFHISVRGWGGISLLSGKTGRRWRQPISAAPRRVRSRTRKASSAAPTPSWQRRSHSSSSQALSLGSTPAPGGGQCPELATVHSAGGGLSSIRVPMLKTQNGRAEPGHLMHGLRSGEGRQPILMSLPSLTDCTAASASASAARPSAPEGEIFVPFSIAAMKAAISLA